MSSVSNGLLLSNCLWEAQIGNWPVTLVEKLKYLLSFPCPITHMHAHTQAHTHTVKMEAEKYVTFSIFSNLQNSRLPTSNFSSHSYSPG